MHENVNSMVQLRLNFKFLFSRAFTDNPRDFLIYQIDKHHKECTDLHSVNRGDRVCTCFNNRRIYRGGSTIFPRLSSARPLSSFHSSVVRVNNSYALKTGLDIALIASVMLQESG
jgi:hypothetical protein